MGAPQAWEHIVSQPREGTSPSLHQEVPVAGNTGQLHSLVVFFCFLGFFLAFKLNKVCSAPQPHEAAWFAPAHVHCGTVRLARAGLHLLQMEVASPPAPHRSQHQMLPNTKLETHPLAITARE